MFQKLLLDGMWMPRQGENGLGMSDVGLKCVLAVPCPTRDWPLLLIPGFAVNFLDAAPAFGLPPRVYDAYAMFRWVPRLGSRLMFDVAVTPGVYRDFDQRTGDGLRVTSHAAVVWNWTPRVKLVAGAMYLDRRDWNILPLGGMIWEPDPDFQCELLFPQPRIARRIGWFGRTGEDVQDWLYVAGEFGDSIWAIQCPGGVEDRVAYSDIRAFLGMERKVIGSASGRIEVGYVFNRKLVSYDTATPESFPSNTLMLRAGMNY